MLDSETQRYIRQEVQRHLNILIMASSDEATKNGAKVRDMYGSTPQTPEFPAMMPWGFAHRPPTGLQTVLGRIGEHPGARIILGHRDIDKPDLEEGEVILYNENGEQIRLEKEKVVMQTKSGEAVRIEDGKVKLGGSTADQAVVLGTVLAELLGSLMDTLVTGDFLLCTSPGSPTAPNPAKAAQITQWKAQYLTTAATNILSAVCFTQRQKG